jgi:hypothetical protein
MFNLFSLNDHGGGRAAVPPPVALTKKKWQWNVLLVLLFIIFILHLATLDIAGAVICAMLFGLGVIMTRDGMRDIGKYCLIYAILCGLCFIFDIIPLMHDLTGRTTQNSKEPIAVTTDSELNVVRTFEIVEKQTPFFDKREGFNYNLQSFIMIFSPVIMLYGFYLAVHCYICMNRSRRNARNDESAPINNDLGSRLARFFGSERPPEQDPPDEAEPSEEENRRAGSSSQLSSTSDTTRRAVSSNGRTFEGTGYKLPL